MKIGLIGSGGREHALAKGLTKFSNRDLLFVYGSHINPGISLIAENLTTGSLTDLHAISEFFSHNEVDYVIVGPETPLMAGVVDHLRKINIPAVGPTQAQAQIESDKFYMRDLLERHASWGSPSWHLAKSREQAKTFINQVGEIAVKPVGLTGGKGVRVMGVHMKTISETLDYVDEWISQEGKVLLEERLVGEEFSRMVFASNNTIVPMPVAQDFKYAFEGDTGPMTGGMGSYTSADGSMPFIRPEDLDQADKFIQETIQALELETESTYQGILYGQFMLTRNGIRLIEFNARFGDPEAINVMALIQGDPANFFKQIADGNLTKQNNLFAPMASVCKYLVPEMYPEPHAAVSFTINENLISDSGLNCIFASVKSKGAQLETLGSRTMAIVGIGDNPEDLSDKIETLLMDIQPKSLRHRKDIADRVTIQQKIAHMDNLRKSGG